MKNATRIRFALVLLALCSCFESIAVERLVPSEYPTIQAAVNAAADGDVIRIAAGDYREETVVRNKTLSIVGDPGAVLHAHPEMRTVPWSANVAVLAFERANVVVSNLVIEGNLQGDFYPEFRLLGVIFRSSSARLENCIIRGFRATIESQVRAVNINNVVGSRTDVSVVGCSFSDNYISIACFGSDAEPTTLNTLFTIRSNTFRGTAAGASFPTVGLWVSNGAGGTVTGNTFTDYVFNAVENNSVAIIAQDGLFDVRGSFAILRPVIYSGNTFSNNSIHLGAHAANNSKITNNIFGPLAEGALEAGVVLSGANVVIADNNFARMPEAIRLLGNGDTLLGVPRGIARNIQVTGNWFTNVTTTIRTNELVTLEEAGSELCCFAPTFREVTIRPPGKIRAQIRSWHRDPVTIESTTDLNQWNSLGTGSASLPVTEYEAATDAAPGRQFFRLRQSVRQE